MPIEKTANYVRVRQADPSLFAKESFRTINIDAEKGIKAVIGRRPGKDSTEVQTYMFDREKWTVEDAKKWIEDHRGHAEASLLFTRDTAKAIALGTGPMANALKNTKPFQDYLKRNAGMVSVRVGEK
jgi:hypothetical protein